MSKRKKEIQKRKKQVGETRVDNSQIPGGASRAAMEVSERDAVGAVPQEPHSHVDDSQIVTTPRATPGKKDSQKKRPSARPQTAPQASDSPSGVNKENLLLGLLAIYVFLLGLGTVGELFEIEWILNLPLFR